MLARVLLICLRLGVRATGRLSASERCFPAEHLLLRDLQQVTAILRQQIEGVGDVGDVFDVGLFEAEAVEGFQQVAGGAQALDGAFEDVLRVGRCVDDQGLGVGEVGFE